MCQISLQINLQSFNKKTLIEGMFAKYKKYINTINKVLIIIKHQLQGQLLPSGLSQMLDLTPN